MIVLVRRFALLFVSLVTFIALAHSRALALVEYCPAGVHLTPLSPGAASASYALVLDAESPRSITGTIAFHAADGWYSVDVKDQPLTERTERWKDEMVEFKRRGFSSDAIIVDFPAPVDVASAFFSSAQTQGETVFRWDAKGRVPCAGAVDRLDIVSALGKGEHVEHRALKPALEMLDETPSTQTPNPPHVKAVVASAPFPMDCAAPFVQAVATYASPPQYPEAVRYSSVNSGVTYVAVAISGTGAVDDAWVFAPSGNSIMDAEAVSAAKRSRYSPTISFCEPVPAIYLFKSYFHV